MLQNLISKIAVLTAPEFKPILNPCNNKDVVEQKVRNATNQLGSCTYKHITRVIYDCRNIFQNYEQMMPCTVRTVTGQNILELQGHNKLQRQRLLNTNTYSISSQLSNESTTSTHKKPRWQQISMIVVQRFSVNEKFRNNQDPTGVFVVLNDHLSGIKKWDPKTKLLDLVSQLQELLTNNFPFFAKNVTNNIQQAQPQTQWQNNNAPQQYYQQPQQNYAQNQSNHNASLNLPHQNNNASQWNQPSNSQVQQNNSAPSWNLPPQSQIKSTNSVPQSKPQSGHESYGNKIMGSVMSMIPFTAQHKQAELKKEAEELQQRASMEMLNKSQKMQDEIKNQKAYMDKFIKIHEQQIISQSQLCQIENDLNEKMAEAGDQTQQCQSFIESNDLRHLDLQFVGELITMDPLSQQIVNLSADVTAIRETLHFALARFKKGSSDLDEIMVLTKQLSEQMFDSQLLLKKCQMAR